MQLNDQQVTSSYTYRKQQVQDKLDKSPFSLFLFKSSTGNRFEIEKNLKCIFLEWRNRTVSKASSDGKGLSCCSCLVLKKKYH